MIGNDYGDGDANGNEPIGNVNAEPTPTATVTLEERHSLRV